MEAPNLVRSRHCRRLRDSLLGQTAQKVLQADRQVHHGVLVVRAGQSAVGAVSPGRGGGAVVGLSLGVRNSFLFLLLLLLGSGSTRHFRLGFCC